MNETLYRWTFNFHKVVRQQNSGAMEDFILPYSAVYLRIQKWKNYWNRSTFATVIVKIKVARFYGPWCISVTRNIYNYTVFQKTTPQILAVTLSNLNQFYPFTTRVSRKFAIQCCVDISPHLSLHYLVKHEWPKNQRNSPCSKKYN